MPDYHLIFTEIANGKADAYDFCRSFFDWVHTVDDLVDRDKEVAPDSWAHVCLGLITMAATNKFFHEHSAALLSVIRSSTLAYVASEQLRKSEQLQDRVVAEVLKSQYQDVFFEVAFWTGGYTFQKQMAAKHRGYSFN